MLINKLYRYCGADLVIEARNQHGASFDSSNFRKARNQDEASSSESKIESKTRSIVGDEKNQRQSRRVGSSLQDTLDEATVSSDDSSLESEYNELGQALCCSEIEDRVRSRVKPLSFRHGYNSTVLADLGTFEFSETFSASDDDCVSAF